MSTRALLETDLASLKLFNRGKVRDIYDLGKHLLIVASDRISAFDSILANGIPEKGKILTALSLNGQFNLVITGLVKGMVGFKRC